MKGRPRSTGPGVRAPVGRVPRAFAAACAVAVLAWLAVAVVLVGEGLPPGVVRAVDDLGQVAAASSACVAGLWAARRSRGRRRWSWVAIGAGTGSWAAGQAVWSWFELVAHVSSPFPSLADVGYLLFPVGTTLGLVLLPREDSGLARSRQLVDGLIVCTSLAAVSWTTVLGAMLGAADDTSPLVLIGSLAYPAADVVLVTTALLVLARPAVERRTPALLAAGLTAMAVSDTGFAYLTATGGYVTGLPISLGWYAAFLLLAVAGVGAAVQPCSPAGSRPRTVVPARLAVALPYVPLVAAVAVMAGMRSQGRRVDGVEMLLAGTAVLLVLVRQFLTLQENSRLAFAVGSREEELQRMAFSDQLTGLANRALFTDRVAHALELHRRDLRPLAVLFCDLDAFKAVNDSLGHAQGDQLLARVAERLRAVLRPGDTLARLGGDEFAVLLEDGVDPAQTASRLVDAMRLPFGVGGTELSVTMSVGIAALDPGAVTPDLDALLSHADVAMYAAKRSGKARVVVYERGMTLPETQDLELRGPLATALGDGSVTAWLQPVVDLATGRVLGVEALARWLYRGEMIVPLRFVPVAARSGLLPALTGTMLDQAGREVASWTDGDPLWVSVNVSPLEIVDAAFPRRVEGALARCGLTPERLVLEVTEDGLLGNPQAARSVTRELKRLGVRLALDDFGTGYSSLAHLHEIPLDTLKIDRAFVSRLDGDPAMHRMLGAVLGLSRDLGLDVVAEGIERRAQADMLIDLGCRWGQGYLFGRPAPADVVGAALRSTRSIPSPPSGPCGSASPTPGRAFPAAGRRS